MVMLAFGVVVLITGLGMARQALVARERLCSWRGKLTVAGSSIALGAAWILSRGELGNAVAATSAVSIVGYIVGSLVSQRETKRMTGL